MEGVTPRKDGHSRFDQSEGFIDLSVENTGAGVVALKVDLMLSRKEAHQLAGTLMLMLSNFED